MPTPDFTRSLRLLLTASFVTALVACGTTPTNSGGSVDPGKPPVTDPPPKNPPGTPPPPENPPGTPDPSDNANLTLENLSGAPYNDRLVFNRIGNPNWTNKDGTPVVLMMHDTNTVRVKNTGTQAVTIQSANFSKGAWKLENASLPINVPAGGQTELTVRFVGDSAQQNDGQCRIGTIGDDKGKIVNCYFEGTLTLNTDNPSNSRKVVQLAGVWQSRPESDEREPSLQEIVNLFGYKTVLLKSGESLNDGYKGTVKTVGDEVLMPYLLRVDASKPVVIRQIAAFHGAPQNETVKWFDQGNSGNLRQIIDHDRLDAQTVLPRTYQFKGPAQASFNPTGAFGFKVDFEWSDPVLNRRDADNPPAGIDRSNCKRQNAEGHNVRFWPLKNRDGTVEANTYLMAMDAFCINYDYNDNVYVVSNVKPAPAQ